MSNKSRRTLPQIHRRRIYSCVSFLSEQHRQSSRPPHRLPKPGPVRPKHRQRLFPAPSKTLAAAGLSSPSKLCSPVGYADSGLRWASQNIPPPKLKNNPRRQRRHVASAPHFRHRRTPQRSTPPASPGLKRSVSRKMLVPSLKRPQKSHASTT